MRVTAWHLHAPTRLVSLTLWVIVVVLLLGAGVLWWHYARSLRYTAMFRSDPEALLIDPVLRDNALSDGRIVFLRHCAACHGTKGKADPHRAIPDLTDSDFLYGQGKVSQIEQIVLHGIRAGDSKGLAQTEMPGFARKEPYGRETLPSLTPAQIAALVSFLRSANGYEVNDRAHIEQGRKLFMQGGACWDCHGSDGSGDAAVGAPDLVDGVWLKGTGSEAELTDIIAHGMAGESPAFQKIITAYDARVVAAYTASLHPALR